MSATTVSRSAMAAILGMHWLCAYIYVDVLFICIPASGYAYQLLPHSKQAEARDPAGKITVEASVIQVVVCNGPGENGGQFYIYQYVNRPGFRAIKPPNWGQPLGGSDYPSREQAAAVACGGGSLPPGGGSPWAGQWRLTWGASTATLTLAVTGSTAQGQYDYQGGQVVGQISGNTLSGTWSNVVNGGSSGPFTWILTPDGQTFTGFYVYQGSQSAWNGTRIR